ncbi:MAG: hypothetical protein FJ288_08865 [Planctomycetes bacterium]|nr:hypothetical protein [Planctomycetota bacterium]
MSTDARIPTDQGRACGHDAAPPPAGDRTSHESLVQESIKYRRRAQEAERRAEALETEVQALRDAQDQRASDTEAELAQARGEAESLRSRLEAVERDRRLERELARAGCADPETALALARERLAGGDPPEDLAAFARGILDEKPHLRATPGSGAPVPVARTLPPRTAAAKSSGHVPAERLADRLAQQARQSGNTTDLMTYMRARRAAGA